MYNMRDCYPQPRVVVVVVIMVLTAVVIAEEGKLYRFEYTISCLTASKVKQICAIAKKLYIINYQFLLTNVLIV